MLKDVYTAILIVIYADMQKYQYTALQLVILLTSLQYYTD